MKTKKHTLLSVLVFLSAITLFTPVSGGQAENYRGFYRFGHEVRTFQTCGSEQVYWVRAEDKIDKELREAHQKLTTKPYTPIYAELRGRLMDRAAEGFAANYDGQIIIESIVLLRIRQKEDCGPAKVSTADILKWILVVVGVASGILFLFVFWNRSLAKQVKERTGDLKRSNESLEAEISERKKAEDVLRGSHDYLKDLTDSMGDVVFSVKMPERKIEWVNDSSFNILGYDPEELIGRTTEFLYRNRNEFLAFGDKLTGAVAEGKDIVQIAQFLRRKSGEAFPVELTVTIHKEKGEVVSATGIIRDITERRQAEQALRESEEKFRSLVTNTEEIVYMIHKDGTFLLSEGKGLSKLGLKPGQVVGKSVFELYKDYPQMLASIRKAFNGETVTTEVNVDGNYFRNWYTPHQNHEGEIIGLLGLSVNITEQKQSEQMLQAYQQRLKALAFQLTIAEEKERRRIAADLHDHVSQSLALARMQLASARKSASEPKLADKLDDISDTLIEALENTQQLMFQLSSPLMNEIGLSAAISEWLEEQIGNRHGLKTEFLIITDLGEALTY